MFKFPARPKKVFLISMLYSFSSKGPSYLMTMKQSSVFLILIYILKKETDYTEDYFSLSRIPRGNPFLLSSTPQNEYFCKRHMVDVVKSMITRPFVSSFPCRKIFPFVYQFGHKQHQTGGCFHSTRTVTRKNNN